MQEEKTFAGAVKTLTFNYIFRPRIRDGNSHGN